MGKVLMKQQEGWKNNGENKNIGKYTTDPFPLEFLNHTSQLK